MGLILGWLGITALKAEISELKEELETVRAELTTVKSQRRADLQHLASYARTRQLSPK